MMRSIIAIVILFAGLAGAQDMHQRMWDWMELPSGDPAWMTGQVVYYPLDGDGTDAVGGFDGTVGANVAFTNDAVRGTAGAFRAGVSSETPASMCIQTDFKFQGDNTTPDEYTAFGDGATFSVWAKYVPARSFGSVDAIFEARDGTLTCGIIAYDFGTPTTVYKMSAAYLPSGTGLLTLVAKGLNNYKTHTNWTHYAVTYEWKTAAILTAKTYLNGVQVSTYDKDMQSRRLWFDCPMMIGQRGNLGGRADTWGGFIDEVRIWNRALSSNEVAEVYNYDVP